MKASLHVLYGSNEKQLLIRSDWLNCVNDQSYSACSAEAKHPLRTAGAQPECHDHGQGHRSSCAKQYSLVPYLYKLFFFFFFHGETDWNILS